MIKGLIADIHEQMARGNRAAVSAEREVSLSLFAQCDKKETELHGLDGAWNDFINQHQVIAQADDMISRSYGLLGVVDAQWLAAEGGWRVLWHGAILLGGCRHSDVVAREAWRAMLWGGAQAAAPRVA